MRKITLIVALIGLSIAANAQSVKLQSAISDLRNGRLNKAKANIDAAAEHEDTKNDPKTWIYRGLIYCQLGAPDVKDKYKGLFNQPKLLNIMNNASIPMNDGNICKSIMIRRNCFFPAKRKREKT